MATIRQLVEAKYVGGSFKSLAGAQKRAAFENAQKKHTAAGLAKKSRHHHSVEKVGDEYRVRRETR